ncbi:phytanoyl-CoA dioxygenase family protein [Arthrobacter sp. NPDC090010]|uniref:phytanoyl-CoA dioxygenase family protein n=1 Tax=Arthrobacter sp. NPDC090010 TaxID=3363942 RepID=UPI0037FBF6E9
MDLKEELNSRGYAVLRGVHDKELLTAVQSAVLDELIALGISDGKFEAGQPYFVAGEDENVARAASLPIIRRSERIRALTGSEEFRVSLAKVFGDEVFVHPNRWVRAMPPDSEGWAVAPSIHADCFELQGSMRQVTMWTPVFPVTESTGSLPVYASNNGNQIPEGLRLSSDNQSGWTLDPPTLGTRAVYTLEPGDAIVFYATTPHGGAVNTGNSWRVSIETRFQAFSDPICDNALQPYDGSTWKETLSPRAYAEASWITRHPEVVQFDRVWEDWRALEALKLGAQGDPEAVQALINAQLHSNPSVRARASQILEEQSWA